MKRPMTSKEILALADCVGKDIANTRSYEMREWAIIEDALRALAIQMGSSLPVQDGGAAS